MNATGLIASRSRERRHRRNRGATLTELVIAIALVGLALPSMTAIMGDQIDRSVRLRLYRQAIDLADAYLERTRAMDFAQLAPLDGDRERTGVFELDVSVDEVHRNRPNRVVGSAVGADMIRIRVTVTWSTDQTIILEALRSNPQL